MRTRFVWAVGLCLAAAGPAAAQDFGVEMPANPAPGVSFPTPETEINSWVFGDTPDHNAIYAHGWGLWAGLTQLTTTTAFGIENARVYQTWLSPAAIIDYLKGVGGDPIMDLAPAAQFTKHQIATPSPLAEPAANSSGIKVDRGIAEVVAYSPSSARHAYDNQLFFADVMEGFIAQGYTSIPRFPPATVNIKPVYKVVTRADLSSVNGKELYAMPSWPGTPDTSDWTDDQKKAGYGNENWGQCVYVDLTLDGPSGASGVDPTCQKPDPSNTYAVDDFISIGITSADIAYLNELTGEKGLEPGDLLLLVGMHVTTREVERWTWQSFWWTANADAPNLPSSDAIAAARPGVLDAQSAHYAMTVTYSMLEPAQPLVGGRNAGKLVVGYNPHLEAGFGTGVFALTQQVATPGGAVTTDLGVQSNCMTCHGYAAYGSGSTGYASNYYVPRDASPIQAGVDADFAWSIVDNIVER